MCEEVTEKENSLKDFYSHTSRAWNSAVTITIAIIALSAAAMFSLKDYSIILRVIFAAGSYLVVVFFGFYRIVELGCQLQFLESELKVGTETLLTYVSGKKGDEGNVPRITWTYNRMSFEEAQALRKTKIGYSNFKRHQRIELVLLAILYIGLVIAPNISKSLP